jgi:hypothetical protein
MTRPGPPSSPTLIRILGEQAGSGVPGAILGLPPGNATEEQIATALRRQLARVDAHPRAFTAEAESVRQALRDAAVSLMKSGGSVELPWRGPSATGGPAPSAFGAERAPAPSVDWESYSPKRKVDPAIIVGGLVFIVVFAVVGLSVVLGTKTTPPAPPPAPAPAPATAATAAAPAAPAGPTAAAPPVVSPTAAPLTPTDPTLALRGLRGAAARIKSGDLGATADFAAALQWLGANWVKLDLGQRRAADDAIVEYLYAAGQRAEAWDGVLVALTEAVSPLTLDAAIAPGRVWPAAFGAGVLQRLSREREFPSQYANDLARLHIAALGEDRPRQSATFEAGAAAALRRLIPRIVAKDSSVNKTAPLEVDVQRDTQRVVDALARWAEAIAASGLDAPAQEQLLVDAIEALMLRAEPEADPAVFAGIQQLAVAVKWRRDGPARDRLLAWFDDPRFSASDLSVLTTALATKSGAEGVDATMLLSAGASPMDRQTLRERYAQAWGASASASRIDATEWYDFARSRLDDPGVSGAVPDDLVAAALLARINQAARLLWAGDTSAAGGSIVKAERFVSSHASRLDTGPNRFFLYRNGPDRAVASSNADWAVAYLAIGRHTQNRLAKFAELEQGEPPVGVDAAVLADEACFGSPPEVRTRAQQVVIKFGRAPSVVSAVLDSLPRAAQVEPVSRMIEVLTGATLPKPTHPDWALHARRALVTTLVDALAADSEQVVIDDAAHEIAEAYSDAIPPVDPAALATPATPPPPGAGDAAALAAVSSVWDGLIDKARAQSPNPGAHATLESIEARRRARRSLAGGPVQRWAAEQAAVCDLLAYVTAAERPAAKPRVRAIMDELAVRRRGADSIARQIRTTEHAMTLLWVVRLNAGGGAS